MRIYERGLAKVKIGTDSDRTVGSLTAALGPDAKRSETAINAQSVTAGTEARNQSRSIRVLASGVGRNGLPKPVDAGSNVS